MSDLAQAAPAADALNVGQEAAPQAETQAQPDQQAAQAQQAAQQAKKIKSLNLKVYGSDVTEELPFEIDDNPEVVEYLTKQLQLSKAAQRAMQENSTFQKQVQGFFEGLKSNTREALQQMGIDPKEFAASVIEEELKLQQLSPEQREKMELEQKIKKLEDERKKEKEELEKRELSRLQQLEYERIDKQMTDALSSSDLPKSTYTVKKIAGYMLAGAKAGVNLTAQDVLPLVREEIQSDLKELIAALGEDKVESFIGKDVLNKIRKKNIAKAKATPATAKAAVKDVAASNKADDNKPSEKVSFKDFFKV